MVTEQIINITAQMYAARKAMRFLFGDRYEAEVREIMPHLKQLAEDWKLSLVQTMLRASQELTAKGDNGVGVGMLIAAYVEDVEGTFNEQTKHSGQSNARDTD